MYGKEIYFMRLDGEIDSVLIIRCNQSCLEKQVKEVKAELVSQGFEVEED